MASRVEIIGGAALYLGDCREILPSLERVDAVVTDPPYGQGLNVNVTKAGGSRAGSMVQSDGTFRRVNPNVHRPVHGDDGPFNPNHLLGIAPLAVIWGAHKFADRLPRGSWLVWDKVPTGKVRHQGCGEAAWDSRPDRPMRIHRLLWDGLCVGSGARHEVTAGQQRLHPTQKPESLMAWTIGQLSICDGIICDPYMGVGSTGVAAVRMGFGFVGIEIDEVYFDIACRRIEAAARQPLLFSGESLVRAAAQTDWVADTNAVRTDGDHG